jgi:hypothetical protein
MNRRRNELRRMTRRTIEPNRRGCGKPTPPVQARGGTMTRQRGLWAMSLLFICLLSLTAAADAQHPVLHPNGFGVHSYAAWKAQQGLPDSSGAKNQALYFQKDTVTATFAAGVAVIDGFEGQDTAAILPLGFDWRMDGHCGAGAPRFNVRIQPPFTTDPMLRQTIFVGCLAMAQGSSKVDAHGRLWQQKIFAGPLPPGTITSLSIMFDEGTDQGAGFVYLDNIQVGTKVWTSATDNGNEQ